MREVMTKYQVAIFFPEVISQAEYEITDIRQRKMALFILTAIVFYIPVRFFHNKYSKDQNFCITKTERGDRQVQHLVWYNGSLVFIIYSYPNTCGRSQGRMVFTSGIWVTIHIKYRCKYRNKTNYYGHNCNSSYFWGTLQRNGSGSDLAYGLSIPQLRSKEHGVSLCKYDYLHEPHTRTSS